MIGEEGLSLSGGQRQRLALARAVAARPAVLVLDDPLSALDVDTEARVEGALREVLRETTTLVVAHRPSTVTLADRVALLEDGRITAVGRHSDLLAHNEPLPVRDLAASRSRSPGDSDQSSTASSTTTLGRCAREPGSQPGRRPRGPADEDRVDLTKARQQGRSGSARCACSAR